ncbi:unnamed protein product, partial [Owenia fusiformis]
ENCPPRTRYTLKTFEIKKSSSHSLKKQLNDQSKVVKCLKKQIEVSKSSLQPCGDIQNISPYPLSICETICDKKGKILSVNPFKNSKSVARSFFEKRYKESDEPIFYYATLPPSFDPLVYIIDGMSFLYSFRPYKDFHVNFITYLNKVYSKLIDMKIPIHLVFDIQETDILTPKTLERTMRDSGVVDVTRESIRDTDILPSNFDTFIKN